MSRVPPNTLVDTPGRVLVGPGWDSAALRDRLSALRPLSRGAMISRLGGMLESAPWLILYRRLFDRLPVHSRGEGWYVWGVCEQLASEVNHELFPVSYDLMNECAPCGDNPLDYPIMFQGYGVPWEYLPILGLAACLRPLVAIYGLSTCCSDACDPLEWQEMLSDWWDQLPHGRIDRVDPGGFSWPGTSESIEVMAARLEALDPPLDGLGALLRCVVKDTGNPFLDTADTTDYGDYSDAYYDRHCYSWRSEQEIKRLARFWVEAKPAVDRMLAYGRWFRGGAVADRTVQVVNLLLQHGAAADMAIKQDLERRRNRTLAQLFSDQELGK